MSLRLIFVLLHSLADLRLTFICGSNSANPATDIMTITYEVPAKIQQWNLDVSKNTDGSISVGEQSFMIVMNAEGQPIGISSADKFGLKEAEKFKSTLDKNALERSPKSRFLLKKPGYELEMCIDYVEVRRWLILSCPFYEHAPRTDFAVPSAGHEKAHCVHRNGISSTWIRRSESVLRH